MVFLPVGFSAAVEDNDEEQEEDEEQKSHQNDEPNFLQDLRRTVLGVNTVRINFRPQVLRDGIHWQWKRRREGPPTDGSEGAHANRVWPPQGQIIQNDCGRVGRDVRLGMDARVISPNFHL